MQVMRRGLPLFLGTWIVRILRMPCSSCIRTRTRACVWLLRSLVATRWTTPYTSIPSPGATSVITIDVHIVNSSTTGIILYEEVRPRRPQDRGRWTIICRPIYAQPTRLEKTYKGRNQFRQLLCLTQLSAPPHLRVSWLIASDKNGLFTRFVVGSTTE